MLGVASPKIKSIVGAVFIVVMLLVGTFAFMGAATNYDVSLYKSEETIKSISYENGVITVVATEDGLDLQAEAYVVTMMSFGSPLNTGGEAKKTHFENVGGGVYKATPATYDKEYNVIFVGISKEKTGDDYKQIYRMFLNTGVSDSAMMSKNLAGAGYTLFLVALMYFIMVIFSEWMRRSARKARTKMEAEGRMYPEGYSKCTSCGTMVLPGEITCRKCGAAIEVPDDVKVLHKKDFFECSECGAEVPMDANCCPKCGAKFDEKDETEITHADGSVDVSSETFECSECGKEVPSNAKRCPYCGAEFDEEEK
jgi:ribosomal protein L40E